MDSKRQSAELTRLDRKIGCIKYTIFSFNAFIWINAVGIIGLSLGFQTWPAFANFVDIFKLPKAYEGIYVLIACLLILIIIASIGCAAAIMEHVTALYTHAGLHAVCSVLELAGLAVLLSHYSAFLIVTRILGSLFMLPINTQSDEATGIPGIDAENIECLGAEGLRNVSTFTKPVNELDLAMLWIIGVVLFLSMLHVVLAVLSVVLVQAKKKEKEPIFKRLVTAQYT